jgi:hypothetical protein
MNTSVSAPGPKVKRRIIIAFSIPLELLPLLNWAAAESGYNRSAYLSWLISRAVKIKELS